MTITPEKLRELAREIEMCWAGEPLLEKSAQSIRQAADEIERLQSDLHAVIQSDQDALTPQEITEQNRIVRERPRPMTTETMIERMARAICREAACDPHTIPDLPAYVDDWWPEYAQEARAALQALREPTEEMEVAASMALSALYRGDGGWIGDKAAREQFRLAHFAAIDAALRKIS